ncbi:hypothetical protein [Brucella gallinifaecis]|uniref:hypothetical protein n=1 Tax=Brucella gallinifaecis TaxID=215590 RepID=UPI00235DCCB1|nr:hypothetical protein [Brucella gallinifaecis]
MALNLKKPTNTEIDTDEINEALNARDQEIKDAFDEKQMSIQDAQIVQANLLAAEAQAAAYQKDLENRKAMADRADAVKRETSAVYAQQKKAIEEAAYNRRQLLREERENFNFSPDYFKNINLDGEFLSNLKTSVEENTLTKEAKKVFDEKAKELLNSISEKTVNLRNASYADSLKDGATQVIDKKAIDLLHSGDRLSTASLIMSLEQRSARINAEHESRLDDMRDRAERARDQGDDQKADYFDLKIAHEEAAFERDLAKNVLSQYEFMDSHKGETDRIREQREAIKELSDKADFLLNRVQESQFLEEMSELKRDTDIIEQQKFDAETAQLDQQLIDDFSDIETDNDELISEVDAEEEIEREKAAELAEIEPDYESDFPYEGIDQIDLAEYQADDEIQKLVEGTEEYDFEPSEDADLRALEDEVERNNDAVRDGRDVETDSLLPVEFDIDIESDEDTRTEDQIAEDAGGEEEDSSELRYEMKDGIVHAVVEEKPVSEDDLTEGDTDYVSPDGDMDFGQPEFDDEIVYETDSTPAAEDDYKIKEIDINELDIEAPEAVTEDTQKAEKLVDEVSSQDVDTEVVKTEEQTVADVDVDSQVVAEKPVADVEKPIVEAQKSEIKGEAEQSLDENSSDDESLFSASDDAKFRESFNQRLEVLNKEISDAEASGDDERMVDTAARQTAVLKEFNSYLSDRENLNATMKKLDSLSDKMSDEKNSEKAKSEYMETLDKAADKVVGQADKPWSQSMASELNSFHGDTIKKLDAEDEGSGQQLRKDYNAFRETQKADTIVVTKEYAEAIKDADRQSDKQTSTESQK